MPTIHQARKLALSLPEAEEHEHWGRPSFRVRKKIFATLWPREKRAVLKLPLSEQAAVVALDPETFSTGPWSHQGWTFVELTRVGETELEELLTMAWRELAPERARAAHKMKK